MSHLVFPSFKVDHTSGIIEGAGKHKLPDGKMIDYTVSGKIDYESKNVKFIETIPSL